MDFLNSGLGQYLVQTFFHSLIIALVVEGVIGIWRPHNPYLQIKFRLLPLLLPVSYLPWYYLFYPQRASADFHQEVALIDFHEWLALRLGGGIALWHLFVALLALTTLFFIIREAIPSLRHSLAHGLHLPVIVEGQFPKLDSALANLRRATGHPMPPLCLSDRDAPVVYSQGRRALVLSAATIDMLDSEELEAVMAHELAHLCGQASIINRVSLVLRFLMFYNPIALLLFRRIASDCEKLCDDIAASYVGKRLAVASGLLKIFRAPGSSPAPARARKGRPSPRISNLEDRACRELVKQRVERMVSSEKAGELRYQHLRVALTAGLLVALLFFVV